MIVTVFLLLSLSVLPVSFECPLCMGYKYFFCGVCDDCLHQLFLSLAVGKRERSSCYHC